MRTRANGCTRGNDTGDASGIRDGKTLPPVGPHRLLLPHRAATAAHRGLKELERTVVESTTILLGDSEESIALSGDQVKPVVVLLENPRITCTLR